MKIRGLFSILVVVIVFFFIGSFFGSTEVLGFVIAGIIFGWGLDYLIEFIINKKKEKAVENCGGNKKILDSSAIIDGRILDIFDTSFIEGEIVVPRFVLEELQLLADSEDGIKRARGRRGLDLVKTLQGKKNKTVIIEDRDYKIKEVDAKLIKLGKELNGDVVTTDFNLNKVATIQGVKVLNINELSNALKPVVIPNEELSIELIKIGDREGQAVGYLNDGTMVVAEDGGPYLGKKITLLVTSVYPTAAGRMIFGRVKTK